VLSESTAQVGRRIRELRESRGWTQGELAGLLDRTQTALSYWEAGKRAPGLDDILELARVFDVETSELLPRPARPLRAVLRAVVEDVDAGTLAAELDRFADAAELLPALEPKYRLPGAGNARDTAEALLAAAAIVKPPVPVEKLAHECGVRVLSWAFEDVDGLVIRLDGGAVIGVNADHHGNRKRFTIAHELGHHLLGHDDSFHVDFAGDLSPAASGEHPGYNWRHERAANDFAANLLMPAALVRDAAARTGDVAKLAQKFQVSPAAMGFRLKNLRVHLA
jgi:Zn-dependent peptidase ImmA (M78 family)/DNA-binding XRE family transcriptional regulator